MCLKCLDENKAMGTVQKLYDTLDITTLSEIAVIFQRIAEGETKVEVFEKMRKEQKYQRHEITYCHYGGKCALYLHCYVCKNHFTDDDSFYPFYDENGMDYPSHKFCVEGSQ